MHKQAVFVGLRKLRVSSFLGTFSFHLRHERTSSHAQVFIIFVFLKVQDTSYTIPLVSL